MRDNFFSELVYFDKSQLSPEAASRLAEYCSSPAFTPEAVSHSSVAAASVCQWVQALHSYTQKRSQLQSFVDQLINVEHERKQVTAAALHLLRLTTAAKICLDSLSHYIFLLPLAARYVADDNIS